MKRARAVTEDFNPVYPYDTPTGGNVAPFVTPPFVSPDGLQESPPGTLSLNIKSPLTITNHQLDIKLGNGLSISSKGELEANSTTAVTAPITNTNNIIGLSYSDGLTLEQNFLKVNLGSGLTFENQSITLNPPTLWTGPAAEPNATVLPPGSADVPDYNACITLSLTKIGPLVNGLISLIGISAPLTPIAANVSSVKVSLLFNDNGQLIGPDFEPDTFGFKVGNTIDTTSTASRVPFMPNVTTYPHNSTGQAGAGHYIIVPGMVNADSSKPCNLIVGLNTAGSSGFSITLEWTGLTNYNLSLGTSTFFFSYLSQDQN
uniref:Fiber n=1 Tax=Simian adenovirus 13 TaxID=38432 RepID=A0A1W5PVA4_9ADEN|nr:fiber [Simian adenovirus 13]